MTLEVGNSIADAFLILSPMWGTIIIGMSLKELTEQDIASAKESVSNLIKKDTASLKSIFRKIF